MQVAHAPEHHWFPPPTKPVDGKFIAAIVFAQFVFFVALLGPAIIGIGVKVQTIVSDAEKAPALATVASLGALFATLGNVLFGRFSDRTTSRFGRRRIWIVGGTVVMTIAFVIMALGTNVLTVTLGWALAQLGANAALAPFIATISDQVPKIQRGAVAAWLGIAQNVGILGGTFLAEIFVDNMIMLFVMPSILAIGAMTLYAVVLPDKQLPVKPPAMTMADWWETFWVSPITYPDFALAWWSRFLITLATFMFTTFRLFYLQDQVNLSVAEAAGAITIGVLIYTVVLMPTAWIAGKISDRTGKRKMLVAGSTLVFAMGIGLLSTVTTVPMFYVVEAILGLAYGVYVGVDLALVVDVLPNPDDAGKDLGVFNIANALPQTAAPIVGAMLLAIGSATNQNYNALLLTAAVAGLIGAAVILPVKGVK